MKENKYKELAFLLLVIAIAFILTCVGFASASIYDLGTFKQYSTIELPQTCASCTYNNLSSVVAPDGTYALYGNFVMTKSDINYDYLFSNTTQLGTYTVAGSGDVNGIPTTWSYVFEITATGDSSGFSISIILIVISVILLLFFIYINNPMMGSLTGMMFIVTGIYIMSFGMGLSSDFYTQTIALILISLGLVLFLASAYNWATSSSGGEEE